MPFISSRNETFAPIYSFPPLNTNDLVPLFSVETLAPSISNSNPFADDLVHYLAPLQDQMIHEYIPGRLSDDPLGGRDPPGGRTR